MLCISVSAGVLLALVAYSLGVSTVKHLWVIGLSLLMYRNGIALYGVVALEDPSAWQGVSIIGLLGIHSFLTFLLTLQTRAES